MAPSLSLKERISSPLEAGTSIADGHYLPVHLNPALDYASKRLLRKGVNATLLVIRRDYQLPTSPLTSPSVPFFSSQLAASAPGSASVSAASTPSRPTFGLKQLVRSCSSTNDAPIRERILFSPFEQFRNACPSPAISEASAASGSTASTSSTAESTFSRRLRWPTSPTNGSVPMTPATPFSIASSSATASTDTGSAVSGALFQNSTGQFGIKLVHIGSTGSRDERILAQTIEKTAKKFRLGAEWFPQAVSPAALDLPTDVVHRSLVQYETLFTSENLTLLSLDHLYTFRTALQSYTRTQASPRLEDAVDELRRLFLSNGRKKLLKSALLAAYRWLDPVSDSALSDVCHMYNRAYGGLDLDSGVESDIEAGSPLPIHDNSAEVTVHELSAREIRVPRIDVRSPQYSHDEPASQVPPHHSPLLVRTGTPLFEHWDIPADEKEFLFDSRFDRDELDELDDLPEDLAAELKELDAIEAWYRDVRINVDVDVCLPANLDTCVPPPPPPPPIVHIGLSTVPPAAVVVDDSEIEEDDDDAIHSEVELEERRTTPKMASPPPPPPHPALVVIPPPLLAAAQGGGSTNRPIMPAMMNLRLQTTFDPKPKAKRRSPTQTGDVQRQGILVMTTPPAPEHAEDEEEEEEDLTARPKSAIVSQGIHWNTASIAAGLQSIDMIMSGGGGNGGCSSPIDGRVQSLQQRHHSDHVGPITPNGYDDISPITRGEWGFFMNGGEFGPNGGRRKGAVEMC